MHHSSTRTLALVRRHLKLSGSRLAKPSSLSFRTIPLPGRCIWVATLHRQTRTHGRPRLWIHGGRRSSLVFLLPLSWPFFPGFQTDLLEKPRDSASVVTMYGSNAICEVFQYPIFVGAETRSWGNLLPPCCQTRPVSPSTQPCKLSTPHRCLTIHQNGRGSSATQHQPASSLISSCPSPEQPPASPKSKPPSRR